MASDDQRAVVGASPARSGGLIRTKLSPSRLPPGWVGRQALTERLRAGRSSTLTLVSAPAGFGRTTL